MLLSLALLAASLIIGSSVVGANTGVDAGWVATLDADGSAFVDGDSSTGYTLIRRDDFGTQLNSPDG